MFVSIKFYIIINPSLIKNSFPNEIDTSNENILITPDYVERFEKCNKILEKLEINCNI